MAVEVNHMAVVADTIKVVEAAEAAGNRSMSGPSHCATYEDNVNDRCAN